MPAPMVREVWVDGVQSDGTVSTLARDNQKQNGEYRTLLVMGERRGGTHFFALDITNSFGSEDGSASATVRNVADPEFLWIFPQPNSDESFVMGQTWSEHVPSPPSIGPVRLKESNLTTYPAGFSERWALLAQCGLRSCRSARTRGITCWMPGPETSFGSLCGIFFRSIALEVSMFFSTTVFRPHLLSSTFAALMAPRKP